MLIAIFIGYSQNIKQFKRSVFFNESVDCISEQIEQSDKIHQALQLGPGSYHKIGIYSITFAEENAGNGSLLLNVYNANHNLINSSSCSLDSIKDWDYAIFNLDTPLVIQKEQTVIIEIVAQPVAADTINYGIVFGKNTGDSPNNIHAVINNVTQNYGINMYLESNKVDILTRLFVIFAILIIFVAVTILYLQKRMHPFPLENVFLIIAIILGSIYLLVIPECETPDEPVHIISAYKFSNCLLGNEDNQVRSCDNLYLSNIKIHYSRDDFNDYIINLVYQKDYSNDNTSMELKIVSGTHGYEYFFAALGITVGRLFHCGATRTFFLGSLFNFIFFTSAIYYSIKKIPFGKEVLFIIASFPMTLQLATSFSYDAMLISLSMILISTVLYMIAASKIYFYDLIVCFITGLLIAPFKVCAYTALCFLLILPIKKLKGSNKKYAYILTTGLVICVLFTILMSMGQITDVSSSTYQTGISDGETYSLSTLLLDPLMTFRLAINTIYQKGDFYFFSLFGSDLGWYDIPIPKICSIVILLCLLYAARFGYCPDPNLIHNMKKHKIVFCSISIICFAMLHIGMLLAWTPRSYNFIEGVQGRYFLPFLPLMLFCLYDKRCNREKIIYLPITISILMQPIVIYSIVLAF